MAHPRVVLALCLLPTTALAALGAIDDFNSFERAFGKRYASEERETRKAVFDATVRRVREHNARGHSWTMGINQFSDWTFEEFNDKVLMDPQTCSATNGVGADGAADLPDSLDWRERGIVSEVKNQAQCGSCWTFSTVGALESHLALKSDPWRAPRLSEQQLVDCAGAFDTAGCDGGLPSHAFEYIKAAGGLSTEFSYPYKGVDQNCSFNASASPQVPYSAGIGIQVPGGSVNLTKGDEDALKFALATKGPVSVAFQVASDFKDYAGGVYSSDVCKNGAMDVNHAVLAVGYGVDPVSNMSYWTIKNSWDYTWGESGYFKMQSMVNMCGVANCNAYPDLYGGAE